MKKKKLSFRAFFDEFIEGNTRFKIRQSVNQIFYGSVNSEKISQSFASKMRADNFVFSSGTQLFKDYIISKEYSLKKKSDFIKKLNLSNLPASGEELCNKLQDYYLSDELYQKLKGESDIYIALIILLEHIMYGKDLISKDSGSQPTDTAEQSRYLGDFWNTELIKAKNNGEKDFPLDVFKEPLGWYIRLLLNHTKLNSSEIARRANLARVTFNRKTNINTKKKRHLYLSDIQEICKATETSLGSILYCFENRNIFEKTPELINDLCMLDIKNEEIQSTKKQFKTKKLLTDPKESPFEKWFGKYYCYFSSTNSKETFSGKKEFAGRCCSDKNYKELSELFTDDHVYCGILTISRVDNPNEHRCMADFKFMVNPERPVIKKYTGTVTISKDKQAVFIELFSEEEAEISFLIIEDTGVKKVRGAIASVLTISSREDHRKPCSERMIISEEKILPNTHFYQVMKANLKIHDRYIRIDSFGFNEVIKELKNSGNPESIDIVNKYNKLEDIGPLNSVERKELAYIKDTHISNLTNLTEKQKIIFESSLRLHSIAPWYTKSNSKKARELIELIRDNKNNL